MKSIHDLLESLKSYLAEVFGDKARVMCEYPDGYMESPMKNAVVAIGIDKIHTDLSSGGYIGTDENGEIFGRMLDITLRFDIMRPNSAAECHLLFEKLCTSIFDTACPAAVGELWCEGLRHDRIAGGFMLTAKAAIKGLAVHSRKAEPLKDIIVRSVN